MLKNNHKQHCHNLKMNCLSMFFHRITMFFSIFEYLIASSEFKFLENEVNVIILILLFTEKSSHVKSFWYFRKNTRFFDSVKILKYFRIQKKQFIKSFFNHESEFKLIEILELFLISKNSTLWKVKNKFIIVFYISWTIKNR